MKEKIITAVLQQMQTMLNNAQMSRLQDILEYELFSYKIEKNDFMEEDIWTNERLLNTFLSAKRVEGCSEKSLSYYQKTIETMLNSIGKEIKYIVTDDLRSYLTEYQSEKQSSRVTIDNIRRILSSFFHGWKMRTIS